MGAGSQTVRRRVGCRLQILWSPFQQLMNECAFASEQAERSCFFPFEGALYKQTPSLYSVWRWRVWPFVRPLVKIACVRLSIAGLFAQSSEYGA